MANVLSEQACFSTRRYWFPERTLIGSRQHNVAIEHRRADSDHTHVGFESQWILQFHLTIFVEKGTHSFFQPGDFLIGFVQVLIFVLLQVNQIMSDI